MTLTEKFEEFMSLYEELKEEIYDGNMHMYERWKAGGFIVDPDIVSMYPSLPEIISDIIEEEDDSDDEDEE